MPLSDYPWPVTDLKVINKFSDLYLFFRSPRKLCSIIFNFEDFQNIGDFFRDPVREFVKSGITQATLDLKLKNHTLYFTEQGKQRSIMDFTFSLLNAYVYNRIVYKVLNHQSSLNLQGSLKPIDIIKLFEIMGRDRKRTLCDKHFSALYKKMIGFGIYAPTDKTDFIASNNPSHWLTGIVEEYIYYDEITELETEVLKEERLLDRNLIAKQQDFLREKISSGEYSNEYYIQKEADYLREFMIAYKEKGVPRSEIELLRDNLDGCELKEPNRAAKLFKDVFSKRKNSDLELEF